MSGPVLKWHTHFRSNQFRATAGCVVLWAWETIEGWRWEVGHGNGSTSNRQTAPLSGEVECKLAAETAAVELLSTALGEFSGARAIGEIARIADVIKHAPVPADGPFEAGWNAAVDYVRTLALPPEAPRAGEAG